VVAVSFNINGRWHSSMYVSNGGLAIYSEHLLNIYCVLHTILNAYNHLIGGFYHYSYFYR
jgi:hypothetical protein